MSLTSFKRRWIEKWCEEVYKCLREGSMCTNVIGGPSEETGGMAVPGVVKSALPLKSDSVRNQQKSQENLVKSVQNLEKDIQEEPLPLVKFSYSHFQDQRRKVERLVHGLPVLSSSATHLDKGPKMEESGMPFIVVQGEEPLKLRGDKDETERDKVTPVPSSLTAQRLAQDLRRQSREVSNGGIRVNIANPEPLCRIKTAPTFNKSNLNKARKLLAKRHSSSRKFDTQHYSPIENCWTMAEVTWS